jgi:hypothetical protein
MDWPVQKRHSAGEGSVSELWMTLWRAAGPAPNLSVARDNDLAVIVPAIFVNAPQLQADVRRAAQSLSADVVHINFEIGSDVMGFDSIFFNIELTDEASHPARLRFVTQHVALTLMNQLKTDENGVHAYFNFRSQSEVASTKDPAWA